jgi:hypothetical protein
VTGKDLTNPIPEWAEHRADRAPTMDGFITNFISRRPEATLLAVVLGMEIGAMLRSVRISMHPPGWRDRTPGDAGQRSSRHGLVA